MELIDFLKNVDFNTEYISINCGENEILKTEFFTSDNSKIVKVTNDIEGFISIVQGESITSFRPEAVTSFHKGKKFDFKSKS